ncbi:dephospho-CoA kinase [Bacillus horti]|uniref:dephospho-CoA kinase n=1 Tax=Caldalkalibacillus horti TaxID=77523 RepID=UPI0027D7724A|nr:dephospho-CoA kinase [Bacillus horti]
MYMVIGLTGGIATGKSTVSRVLIDLGALVIDADKIAREVVKPGSPALLEIKEEFGENILLENGELDRKALGHIVFQNQEARLKLNSIIHPAIRAEMTKQKEEALENGHSFIVMDIPLLFESKLEHMVEQILVVYIPQAVQLERLMQRDKIDKQEALNRINSQISIEEKKHRGHAYVNNSGTIQETAQQLELILKKWSIIT